jgi:hypothetical protein
MPTKAQVHIDRALTNMSVAYIQGTNAFIADKVFPIVPVQKQSDRYFVYKKEDWFRDDAKERAAGTESEGGDYDIDNTPSYFARKYAYHKDVTEEDRTNTDAPLNAENDAVDFVTQKLLLRREVLWASKFFTTGKWSHDITGVDATPSAGQTIKWNLDTSDPLKAISSAQNDISEVTGFMPNTLVLGARAYEALKNHPDILDRIKYTQRRRCVSTRNRKPHIPLVLQFSASLSFLLAIFSINFRLPSAKKSRNAVKKPTSERSFKKNVRYI